jgi:hypothetical protein
MPFNFSIVEFEKIVQRLEICKYFRCLDLITRNTPIEYVKLILSSLNYNTKSEITRVILETGLTTASEPARKWITQFLGMFFLARSSAKLAKKVSFFAKFVALCFS